MSGGRRRAFQIRVTLLLSLLFLVLLYAAYDWHTRRERRAWQRPLNVALVLLVEPGVSPSAIARLRQRLPALEAVLSSEARRYHVDRTPFRFVSYGPVARVRPPPAPAREGVVELVRYSWELLRFSHDADERAGVPSRGFDSRLYLLARPPLDAERAAVEGAGQQGGRIGLASAELDEEMADFALFVATHELFHTLGASDKYDAAGRSLVPQGLADPEQQPRWPQPRAEIMARTRPLNAEHEVPPLTLSELGVGPVTAAEIGWQR